jgi:hypothetical protein
MKNILPLMILVSMLFLTPLATYAEENIVKAPIGEWVIEKKHSSGAVIKVKMNIEDSHKFSGVMLINENVNWTYSGIWELSGNEFTYTYQKSSKQLPENYSDTDIILSVDHTSYKYKSKLSGETGTYTRTK